MLTIVLHIEYLLRNNDCVVLPGIGAFVAHYSSAYLSDNGILMPPAKMVGFNDAISHSDGLLANSIMRKNRVSYDKACRIIASEVESMKSDLLQYGEFEFGSIGKFQCRDGNRYVFTPGNATCNTSYFGLDSFAISKLSDRQAQELDACNEHEDVILFPISRNIFKIAASIIVLCALAFTLTTPIALEDAPDYAGISTIAPVRVENNHVEKMVVNDSAVVDSVGVNIDIDKEAIPENGDSVDKLSVNSNPKYYIVVATFKTNRQAERYVEESPLKDKLKVLGKKGKFYRVYVAESDSYSQALSTMDDLEIAETHPDAWIYKR